MEFFTAFGGNRRRITISCGAGRTDQSFKRECDINYLWNKYSNLGGLPQPTSEPVFMDVSNVEYDRATALVDTINQSFERLPASVRDRFMNNPADLLEFISHEGNYDEALRLGLVNKRDLDQLDQIC